MPIRNPNQTKSQHPKPVRYYIVKADDLAVVKSVPVARAVGAPAAPPVAVPEAAVVAATPSAPRAGRRAAALRPVRRLVRAATGRDDAERSR